MIKHSRNGEIIADKFVLVSKVRGLSYFQTVARFRCKRVESFGIRKKPVFFKTYPLLHIYTTEAHHLFNYLNQLALWTFSIPNTELEVQVYLRL
jgi:hypothetical protein